MRPSRPSRRLAVATAPLVALVTATALVSGTVGTADAARSSSPSINQSKKIREAVTVKGVRQHLRAFQRIADRNDDNRASGTSGYAESRDYVVRQLRKAGYKPTVQAFPFVFFDETTPTELERTAPTPKSYTDGTDFAVMEYSGSGETTAPVTVVDTALTATSTSTSGCETADFAGFPAGNVALMQRGTCSFAQKVANAAAAGAAAAIVFNRGVDVDGDPGSPVLNGTLGEPGDIPAIGASFAAGQELGQAGTAVRVKADVVTEERTTWNVLADTRRGNRSNVVMVGAHLDGVTEGPGMNDNGSGAAAILEVAQKLAKVGPKGRLRNQVRFAFWGAEENGLLGSYHYVEDLVDSNPKALSDIAAYLNFDMIGSKNFVRFVYDGDNSTGQGAGGPRGSGQIEKLFKRYFGHYGLRTEPTAFDGRSDYGPFIENGIPSGGLFSGAEGVKTAREARIYGGRAGRPYDPCYHEACDDMSNLSNRALRQMSDAIAHSVWTLSKSTRRIDGRDGRSARTAADHRVMRGQAEPGDPQLSRD